MLCFLWSTQSSLLLTGSAQSDNSDVTTGLLTTTRHVIGLLRVTHSSVKKVSKRNCVGAARKQLGFSTNNKGGDVGVENATKTISTETAPMGCSAWRLTEGKWKDSWEVIWNTAPGFESVDSKYIVVGAPLPSETTLDGVFAAPVVAAGDGIVPTVNLLVRSVSIPKNDGIGGYAVHTYLELQSKYNSVALAGAGGERNLANTPILNQLQIGTLFHLMGARLGAKTAPQLGTSAFRYISSESLGKSYQSPTPSMVDEYFGADTSDENYASTGWMDPEKNQQLRPYVSQDLTTGLCGLGGVVQVNCNAPVSPSTVCAVNYMVTILLRGSILRHCVVPRDYTFHVATSSGTGAVVKLDTMGGLTVVTGSSNEEWISLAGITWTQDTIADTSFPFASLTGDIAMTFKPSNNDASGQSTTSDGSEPPSVKIVGDRCILSGCAQGGKAVPAVGAVVNFELPEMCRQEPHNLPYQFPMKNQDGAQTLAADGPGIASFAYATTGKATSIGGRVWYGVAVRVSGVEI